MLVVASYVFYCFWSWKFAVMMLVMSVANFMFGYAIGIQKNYAPRKFMLVVFTVINILYLCFFKYTYDFISLLQGFFPDVLSSNTALINMQTLTVLIPFGISYYMFKCMSYVFDVYLCKMNYRKSLFDVLLYVSFFPQVSSGPIVHAHKFFSDFSESLTRDKISPRTAIPLDRALLLILSGLFKKVIIATFLSILVTNKVLATPSIYNAGELIFGLIAYSIVIYCDFSGYSDMAIGIAMLLGFNTEKNFNRPYISSSVSEFWRRWHISFSSWLRDYVYFAMGGSRFGITKAVFALIATMIIAGFWHGAKLTFLVWGAMQGIALAFERIVKYMVEYNREKIQETKMQADLNSTYEEFVNPTKKTIPAWLKIIKILGVFIFVNLSWLVFQAQSLGDVLHYIKGLGNFSSSFKLINPFTGIVLAVGLLLQLPTEKMRSKLFSFYTAIPFPVKAMGLGVFFVAIMVMATSGVPRFIYFQF